MYSLVSLISGLIFGFGLLISGMTQPGKVIGFLDILGGNWQWDLMGVMGGALLVHALTRLLVIKRSEPMLGDTFPSFGTVIDKRLISGAAIFGLGWGIAGFCPGPALVSVMTFDSSIIVFLVAMSAGMLLARLLDSKA